MCDTIRKEETYACELNICSIQDLCRCLSELLIRDQLCPNAIWVTSHAFFSSSDNPVHPYSPLSPSCSRLLRWFSLEIKGSHPYRITIFSQDLPGAISALEYFADLSDISSTMISLDYYPNDGGRPYPEDLTCDCPLPTSLLKKLIARASDGWMEFHLMRFQPSQTVALFCSANSVSLSLDKCLFVDDGHRLILYMAEHKQFISCIKRLRISQLNPFLDSNLAKYLNMVKLDFVEIANVDFLAIDVCLALSQADISEVHLENIEMSDGGHSLVQSAIHGNGPRGYSFTSSTVIDDCLPFDQWATYQEFLNAMGSNCHVRSLSINDHRLDDATKCALLMMLRRNRGLQYVGFSECLFSTADWYSLMEALSENTGLLQSFSFTGIGCFPVDRLENSIRTVAIAKMLQQNPRIHEVNVCPGQLDKDSFYRMCVPILECRQYKGKLQDIQSKSSILPFALAICSKRPWLVWQLLKQNQNVISTHVDESS